MRFTRALVLGSLISIVSTVASVAGEGDQALPELEAVEPAAEVLAKEGEPIRIGWRLQRWPGKPSDWEVTISLSCSVFDHDVPLYSARLDQARSVFYWTPTADLLERLNCSDISNDCDAVPIRVVLFHTKGPDDLLAYHSACKCVPHSPWLFCASSPGVLNLTEAVKAAQNQAGS